MVKVYLSTPGKSSMSKATEKNKRQFLMMTKRSTKSLSLGMMVRRVCFTPRTAEGEDEQCHNFCTLHAPLEARSANLSLTQVVARMSWPKMQYRSWL
jgi:hypothetical protein